VGRGQYGDFVKAFPDMTAYGYADPYVDENPRRFQAVKNVILYSKTRYELVSEGTFWLSLTPEVAGSRMPGVMLPRHVNWVRLKDIPTGREFRVLDTHYDLQAPNRLKESRVIVEEAAPYSPTFPQLLCGDFNSHRTSPEHAVLADAGWFDTYEIVHGLGEAGSSGHGYDPVQIEASKHGARIDFIFFHGNVNPVAAGIIHDTKNGLFPSDHYFVYADIKL
jgi:endonuclease/exonuclease/phosphatase family metal-dependent hydrolase